MKSAESRHRLKSEVYEQAIRRRVCVHCIDCGADGVCHSQDPEGCAIFRFVPELVSIAKRVHAQRIDPYISAVRKDICAKCAHEQPDGKCETRDALDCGLDRYLALVVDAVDEIEKSEEK